MELSDISLATLARALSERVEFSLKREIQLPARFLPHKSAAPWLGKDIEIDNGDDAAAIPQPDGSYLLLAADGMRPEFVASDPWFAGWSAVMVNISDIAAMGGVPWVIVDVLYLGGNDGERILEGMRAASDAYGVPIVGGHTCRVSGGSTVSASILGRAERVLRSDAAQPGQVLLAAVDLRGSFRSPIAFNAATTARPSDLRAQVRLLSELAECGLVSCAKDISNAGICGTIAMILEASGTGAFVDMESICAPEGVDPLRWLTAFPSYGYILSVDESRAKSVCSLFLDHGVNCTVIGTVTKSRAFCLRHGQDTVTLLDMNSPFTGFGAPVRQVAV